MIPLRESMQDYLALRRSLGFKLREAGICLAKFAAFLEDRGATHLTTQLALEWAQQSPSTQPATWAQRLGYVRGFARHHAASDPQSGPRFQVLPIRGDGGGRKAVLQAQRAGADPARTDRQDCRTGAATAHPSPSLLRRAGPECPLARGRHRVQRPEAEVGIFARFGRE